MTDIAARKDVARSKAMAVRAAIRAPHAPERVAAHALEIAMSVTDARHVAVYLPIRHEIDSLPAMRALVAAGLRVGVPVIEAPATPLRFREWTPGAPLERGRFGVMVPQGGDWLVPDVILAPMLAFDAACHRLGYGGGFYDRTIADLRSRGAVAAFGFAYSGQETDRLPVEATDMRLDGVVTENGVRLPG